MRCRLISLFLFAIAFVSAQTTHNVVVWGGLGESSLVAEIENSSTSTGVGGALGGGYELQSGHFLFDVGLGVGLSHSVFSFADIDQTLSNVRDDEGDMLNYIYHQKGRKDSYTNLAVQIPLMAGGAWGGFYFLAGMKLDVSTKVWSRVRTTITASGDYDKFIDEFVNMPEHNYFSDVHFDKKSSQNFSIDPMASIELGYRFGEHTEGHSGWDVPKNNINYRLAVFADCGLLNLISKGNKEFVTFPEKYDSQSNMREGLMVNDVLSTKNVSSDVRNLLIGLKFTVIFRMPEKKGCIICR